MSFWDNIFLVGIRFVANQILGIASIQGQGSYSKFTDKYTSEGQQHCVAEKIATHIQGRKTPGHWFTSLEVVVRIWENRIFKEPSLSPARKEWTWFPCGWHHQLEESPLAHQRSQLRLTPEGECSSPGLRLHELPAPFPGTKVGWGSVLACSRS